MLKFLYNFIILICLSVSSNTSDLLSVKTYVPGFQELFQNASVVCSDQRNTDRLTFVLSRCYIALNISRKEIYPTDAYIWEFLLDQDYQTSKWLSYNPFKFKPQYEKNLVVETNEDLERYSLVRDFPLFYENIRYCPMNPIECDRNTHRNYIDWYPIINSSNYIHGKSVIMIDYEFKTLFGEGNDAGPTATPPYRFLSNLEPNMYLMWDTLKLNEILFPMIANSVFNPNCSVNITADFQFLKVLQPPWGLFSAVRDLSNFYLNGLFSNLPVVYDDFGPEKRNLKNYFQDVDCRPTSKIMFKPVISPTFEGLCYHWMAANHMSKLKWTEKIWRLVAPYVSVVSASNNGSSAIPVDQVEMDPFLMTSLRVSMFRSIMLGPERFKPVKKIQDRSSDLLKDYVESKHSPQLTIHIRRTDKTEEFKRSTTDFSKKTMTDNYFFDHNQSIHHFGKLVEILENSTNIHFKSYFFLSDSPDMYNRLDALESYFYLNKQSTDSKVERFMSSYIHDEFQGNEEFKTNGHLKVNHMGLNQDVVACYFAASEHSSYIIGMGSSAVSQAISQRIGARLGVTPDAIAVWEEDFIDFRNTTRMHVLVGIKP